MASAFRRGSVSCTDEVAHTSGSGDTCQGNWTLHITEGRNRSPIPNGMVFMTSGPSILLSSVPWLGYVRDLL